MSGQHVGRRVDDLLDGRLTACAELEVRTHLGGCASCAAIVHREQQVRAVLRAAAGQAPVPRGDLMAGLMALAAAPPQPVPAPVVPARRFASRSSVLAVAVLGSVSLASAGAIGVGAVAQGAFGGSPTARPSAVQGALTGGAFASTRSAVQPAVAVLRGAATTTSHTGIRWVDAGAASGP